METRFALPIPCTFTPWVSIYSEEIHVDNTLPYDNATGSNLGWHKFTLEGIANDVRLSLINQLQGFYFELNSECFVPVFSSLDIDEDLLPDEHGGMLCSIEDNIADLPNIVRISNNAFLNLNPPETTPFDVFYIDDNNERHITSNTEWTTFLQNQIYPDNVYLQNQTISEERVFYASNTIEAGRNVTNTLPEGDFVIQTGTNVTFSAGNTIVLKPGFHAMAGSYFHAKIDESPDCAKINKPFNKNKGNSSIHEYRDDDSGSTNFILNIIKDFDSKISVYPNPTSGKLILNFNGVLETDISVEIYNSSGMIVYNSTSSSRSFQIDLSQRQNGIYFIKVIANNQIISEKLILQN